MTATDVVTLVVAIVGAITGITALALQFFTWRLSGPRINVELTHAWLGAGGAVSGPSGWYVGRLPPGYDLECIGVEARNRGRMAATVTSWGVLIGVTTLSHVDSPWNKPVPLRLDAGESVTWFVERAQVEAIAAGLVAAKVDGKPDARTLRATVSTGAGRTYRSKRTLRLPSVG